MELPRRHLVLRASFALLFLALAAPPAGAQSPSRATLAYHLGLEARRGGDLALAAQNFAIAVALDPKGVLPRLEWASALLELGQAPAAGQALAPLDGWWSALAAGPDDNGARYARLSGRVAARAGDDDAAIAWFEQAAARAPYDLGLRSELIGRYRLRSENERAIVHLEAAAAMMPSNAEVRVELGRSLLDLTRWLDAEAAFAEAALLDPRMERAWDGLGQARARRGDLTGAEEAYRYGLSVAPASAVLYEHLGDALFDGGRASAALVAYRRAAALSPGEPRIAEKVERAAARAVPAEDPAAPPPPR